MSDDVNAEMKSQIIEKNNVINVSQTGVTDIGLKKQSIFRVHSGGSHYYRGSVCTCFGYHEWME